MYCIAHARPGAGIDPNVKKKQTGGNKNGI